MNSVSYSSGSEKDFLARLASGSIWVRGAARNTIRRMADKGLVEFRAEAICDNRSSRSHEEYHVSLKGK
jgi:hypothetical protein